VQTFVVSAPGNVETRHTEVGGEQVDFLVQREQGQKIVYTFLVRKLGVAEGVRLLCACLHAEEEAKGKEL
jgi:hypothetical protein